jgi:hypothetical protein
MKNKQLYLILIPLALWFLDEIFFFKPVFFFVSLGLGLLIITLGVKVLIKDRSSRFWPAFILSPALFFLSFSFYSAIIASQFWIQVVFLLNAWFVFSYLKNIYYYFSFGAPERESKLRHLLISSSFLSTFAVASVLYGLPIFLSWPFALLLLVFSLISAGLFGQFFIFVKKIEREQKIFWCLNVLVLAEIVGVISFLPLNYNVLGLLAAIVFYLLILFNDWRTENKVDYKNMKWPITIGSLIIIFILLSARWL